MIRLGLAILASIGSALHCCAADKESNVASVLENRIDVHPRLISGAAPVGDAAYAELAARGVRVVVCVDGQRPNVETARRHGLRTIHIPIGYDGVDATAARSAIAVARQIKEPIYVHCHHGKHRGPAMAAVIGRAAGWLDRESAIKLLKQAGTDPKYAGLWRDVDGFKIPHDDLPTPELVEVATISTLASHMVDVSRRFEAAVEAVDSQSWTIAEARLLREAFRESARVCHEDMQALMRSSVMEVAAMEHQLESKHWNDVRASMDRLKESCTRCHQQFRDH